MDRLERSRWQQLYNTALKKISFKMKKKIQTWLLQTNSATNKFVVLTRAREMYKFKGTVKAELTTTSK